MQDQAVVVAGFPISSNTTLRQRGEHEGIAYEISNHGRDREFRDGRGTWCYYISVSEAQLSPEAFAEFWLDPVVTPRKSGWPRVSYDYFAARFADLDWHGGITFYEKFGGIDGAQRYVKMGCDYAHSWDEGRDFDFAFVEREAVQTVAQLQAMYQFKRRCPYFGTYHDASEMVPHPKSGALFSAAGIEAMTA